VSDKDFLSSIGRRNAALADSTPWKTDNTPWNADKVELSPSGLDVLILDKSNTPKSFSLSRNDLKLLQYVGDVSDNNRTLYCAAAEGPP
jgi:hypothetical protein